MGRLDERVAIVTGGGDGIGRGIARRFAAEGAKVLVADVDEAAAKRVAQQLVSELGSDARALRTDVAVKADIVAMVRAAQETWGTVHVLVNNAWGGETLCRIEDKPDSQLAHGFNVAYYGPFWAMQAALPLMKAQGWGRIINLCSLAGVNAFMGTVEYNSAKEALRTLTRTAAREWARFGIVANALCPGAKGAALRRVLEEHPEMEDAMGATNPMGRIGDPETDIAPVAVFLASDDARYLTGNTLFVDGGGHINGVQWAPVLD